MDEYGAILKLAAKIACNDLDFVGLYRELQDIRDEYRGRIHILDGQIKSLRELDEEIRQRLACFDKLLIQFRAMHRINMQVLNLVNAPGEVEECMKGI